MYKEIIIPKSAKHSIDIPREFINKKVTVVLEPEASNGKGKRTNRMLRASGKITFRISPAVRKWIGTMQSDKTYEELRQDALFERYGIK